MANFRARKFIKVFFMMIGAVVLVGFATMFLWNYVMPDIFGLPLINFWQSIAMVALGRILFGHLPGRGPRSREHWKQRWEAKMADMDPEKREKFRKAFRHGPWGEKCGGSPFSEARTKSQMSQEQQAQQEQQGEQGEDDEKF